MRCFSGQENTRLGRDYVRAFLEAFETDPLRAFLVAMVRGEVAGFICGEPGDRRNDRYRSLRPVAAAAFLRRPWLVLDRSMFRMATARLWPDARETLPPGTWFLSMVGIDPRFRERGIGRMLLRAFEEEGRRRGFRRAALYTRSANESARKLYESCGWELAGRALHGRLRFERSLETQPDLPA